MYQVLCYYYPEHDIIDRKWGDSKHHSGTFALRKNVAMAPIPGRPFWDNHLVLSLATEFNLLRSVCSKPTHTMNEREPLLLKVGKAQVLWHTLLWWLPARLHFNFSTCHSMLCRCHCTAGFKCQYLCIPSGGPPGGDCAYNITEPQPGVQAVRVKGKTNPFCMDHESLIKEPFCCAWGERRMRKGKTARSKGFNQYLQAAWLTGLVWANKNSLYLSI